MTEDLLKTRKTAIADEEEDRISNLGDDLLHHILSYVDTQDAVQTSVLSTRWKNLWQSVPRICFDNRTMSSKRANNNLFFRFVSWFLSSPRTSTVSDVSEVRFCSDPLIHPDDGGIASSLLKKLVNYSIAHKTQALEIVCCMWPNFAVETNNNYHPLSNIDSPFLKKLRLEGVWDPKFCWNLPALTTLELKYIDFGATNCVDLFSQFPSLKHLTLTKCLFSSILETFAIINHGLVSLVIDSGWSSVKPSFKFVVSAPNLLSFGYFGDGDYPIMLKKHGDLDRLERVKIHFPYPCSVKYVYDFVRKVNVPKVADKVRVGNRLLNLFRQLSKAVHLELSSGVIQFLLQVPELVKIQPSPFNDLKHLKFVNGRGSAPLQTIPSEIIDYFVKDSLSVRVINEIDQEGHLSELSMKLIMKAQR